MKKNKLRFLLCLGVFITSLTSCALIFPFVEKHTITFDTQGGSYIEPQEVIHGEKAIKPEDPIKNRCEFIYLISCNTFVSGKNSKTDVASVQIV
jgi:hypothetical protein